MISLVMAKIVFISAENKPALMAQLGMTGQSTVESINDPLKHRSTCVGNLQGPIKSFDTLIRVDLD